MSGGPGIVVGVEASVLVEPSRAGVYQYTSQVLEAAARAAPADRFELAYLNLLRHRVLPLDIDIPNSVERRAGFVSSVLHEYHLRSPVRVPFDVLTRTKADVFFFPNFVAYPTRSGAPSVPVIHDLSFLRSREHGRARFTAYLARHVPETVARARHIVVVSEAVRDELVAEYAPQAPVTVISPGVDVRRFRPDAPGRAEIPGRYGLDRPYVLFTGTLEPRKNVATLLRAFALLPRSLRDRYGLVLAGRRGWGTGEVDALVAELRVDGAHVVETGYVPSPDLPALYACASAFAYPSTYEGFGMPVLEAMASGVPVVASGIPAVAEAAGDAALLFDPLDPADVARALERVLDDADAAAELRDRGLEHATRFDWDVSGTRLARVLHEAAGRDG